MARELIRRLQLEVGDLLSERASGPALAEYEQWSDDPVGFDVHNGRDPVDYQREILRSYIDNKYTVVAGCHGSGKEWLCGSIATHAAVTRGMLVLVLSATETQVVGQTMREVRDACRAAGFAHQSFTRSIRINGEDRVIALTGGSSIDALTGWHDRNGVLIIISEAQGSKLEDSAYDAAFAVAVDDKSRVIVMGNPTKSVGKFAQILTKDHWAVHTISAFDTPNIKAGRMVRDGFPAPGWPAEIAREYGIGSAYYQGRVLAQVPSSGESSLFNRLWLDSAAEKDEAGTFAKQASASTPIFGIDVARYGPDRSVIAVKRGPTITKLISWRGASTTESVERIVEEAEDQGINPRWHRMNTTYPSRGEMIIDGGAMGAGVIDPLRDMGFNVTEYLGGMFTSHVDRKRFLNMRSRSFWRLRCLLEDGLISLPRNEELFAELLAINWSTADGDKVQIEKKSMMKKRLGRSPDFADAVVMSFAEVRTSALTQGTYLTGHGGLQIFGG